MSLWPHPYGVVSRPQPDGADLVLTLGAGVGQGTRDVGRVLEVQRLLAGCKHPSIAGPTTAHLDGQHISITFDARGESLDRVRARGPVGAPVVASIVRALVDAIAEAQRAGVLHRALSLASLIVDGDRVRVADFGLGELLGPDSPHAALRLLAMTPERVFGLPPSPSEDVYLIGCVAYHLVAGDPPFVDDDAARLRRRHAIEDPPRLPRSGTDAMPVAMCRVIERCLAKEADDRPPNAASVALEWATAVAEAGLAARPAAPTPTAAPAPAPRAAATRQPLPSPPAIVSRPTSPAAAVKPAPAKPIAPSGSAPPPASSAAAKPAPPVPSPSRPAAAPRVPAPPQLASRSEASGPTSTPSRSESSGPAPSESSSPRPVPPHAKVPRPVPTGASSPSLPEVPSPAPQASAEAADPRPARLTSLLVGGAVRVERPPTTVVVASDDVDIASDDGNADSHAPAGAAANATPTETTPDATPPAADTAPAAVVDATAASVPDVPRVARSDRSAAPAAVASTSPPRRKGAVVAFAGLAAAVVASIWIIGGGPSTDDARASSTAAAPEPVATADTATRSGAIEQPFVAEATAPAAARVEPSGLVPRADAAPSPTPEVVGEPPVGAEAVAEPPLPEDEAEGEDVAVAEGVVAPGAATADDQVTALITRARAAKRSGRTSEAIAAYREVLEVRAEDPGALAAIARIHFDRGAFGDAVTWGKRLVGASPGSAKARVALGDAYYKLGDVEAAEVQYRKAAKLGHKLAAARLETLAARP